MSGPNLAEEILDRLLPAPTATPRSYTDRPGEEPTVDSTADGPDATREKLRKLLRAGCTVIATTRFPNSSVAEYRKERDFDSFRNRLHVYGLDLRDAELRWQDMADGTGYWAVLRHADVVAVSRQPLVFSASTGGVVTGWMSTISFGLSGERMISTACDSPSLARNLV